MRLRSISPRPDAGGALRGLATALVAISVAGCAAGVAPTPAPAADARTEAFVDSLQARTFAYFWETTNPRNGLAPDRWPNPPFASIAAVGFALAAYPIGVERRWVTRADAAERALTTLRFMWGLPQGTDASGLAGDRGFFYHFLDMETGLRYRNTELSTIDTALLLAGVLVVQQYFDGADGRGPTDTTIVIGGISRRFRTYWARGAAAPYLNDDGTIAPTAAGGSIPFAPDITGRALVAMRERYGDDLYTRYGFLDAFNPTLQDTTVRLRRGRIVAGKGWFDDNYLGIDQGPIVAMIENHRSELLWNLMKKNPYIVRGLCRAGFSGGWIDGRCN